MNTVYAINKRTKEHQIVGGASSVSSIKLKAMAAGWKFVEADADGWIPWNGGERPLPLDSLCEIKTKAGIEAGEAGDFLWGTEGLKSDIIDYRPILSEQSERSVLDADDEPEAPKDGIMRRALLRSSKIVGPEAPEWSGEGLPPVGCECEVSKYLVSSHKTIWVRCEIVAHRNGFALAWIPSEYECVKHCIASAFRPTRPEEERAVDEMMNVLGAAKEDSPETDDVCRTLYRAGYKRS